MEAGQSHTDDISRGTTDGMEHIPCSTMGPMLPALSLAHPMQANRYHKPSAEYKCLIGDRRGHEFPPASVSTDNPDNDPTPSKKELLVEAAKDDYQWPGQGTANMKMMSISRCSPEASVAALTSVTTRYGLLHYANLICRTGPIIFFQPT
jgi:hypothetical protein